MKNENKIPFFDWMFSELGLDRSTFRSSRKMDDSVFYCFYSNDSTKTKTNIKTPQNKY